MPFWVSELSYPAISAEVFGGLETNGTLARVS